MIVEAIRLLVTLATTAVGFRVGAMWQQWAPGADPDVSVVWGAIIGAGVGYVIGGGIGRVVRRSLDRAPEAFDRATGPELFAGAFGVITGVIVAVVLAVPMVVFLPGVVGWPLALLAVLVFAAFGGRVFAARAADLLAVTGLRERSPLMTRTAAEAEAPRSRFVIDSAAAIDGRILELARAGLLRDDVLVPSFVVDELQAIADSGDKSRRRRGRRGLDVLDALRDIATLDFAVLDESVPEFEEVDAKLLAVADRLEATLVTTDHNLAKAAGIRGLAVLNPHALSESLRPTYQAGDSLRVQIDKPGSEPGQGVGYLDDGTMVVVAGAADKLGEVVEAEVSNMLRTSIGRMVFARRAG